MSGDLISRQAVLDELNKWEWQELYLPIHFKENIIDVVPPVNPQEPKTGHWIPVSERLPELREDEDDTFISDNVLVWLSHEFDAENPMICYYFKYDEWEGFVPTALCKDWQDINSGLIHPVAWMPLPEPYKAESEDKE